jgi:hypothetical protein
VLRHSRNALERSPSLTAQLHEEQIQFILLVSLNAVFEGLAGGEVFNHKGKTDILIRMEDTNFFVGECKIWTGPSDFTKAISQRTPACGARAGSWAQFCIGEHNRDHPAGDHLDRQLRIDCRAAVAGDGNRIADSPLHGFLALLDRAGIKVPLRCWRTPAGPPRGSLAWKYLSRNALGLLTLLLLRVELAQSLSLVGVLISQLTTDMPSAALEFTPVININSTRCDDHKCLTPLWYESKYHGSGCKTPDLTCQLHPGKKFLRASS